MPQRVINLSWESLKIEHYYDKINSLNFYQRPTHRLLYHRHRCFGHRCECQYLL